MSASYPDESKLERRVRRVAERPDHAIYWGCEPTAYLVHCPICGALAGEVCRNATGKRSVRAYVHRERAESGQRALTSVGVIPW